MQLIFFSFNSSDESGQFLEVLSVPEFLMASAQEAVLRK